MKGPAAAPGTRRASIPPWSLFLLCCCFVPPVLGSADPPGPSPGGRGPSHDVPPGLSYRKVDYLFPSSSVREPRIYVCKSRRRLVVLQDDVLIRDYPVALGPSPEGDKLKRGDGRTPEGTFYVCVKNPRSRYLKSLGLSYPGSKQARRTFLAGLLPFGEYRNILDALERKQRPPWNTYLGGAICIHGGGAHEDWTRGCIALYNYDMTELYDMVSIGNPVFIRP